MNYRKFENMRLCQIHYTKHECLLVKPLHENTKAKNNHEIKTRQKIQKKNNKIKFPEREPDLV